MSTGFPYGSFLSTSGDRYPGVPAKPRDQERRTCEDTSLRSSEPVPPEPATPPPTPTPGPYSGPLWGPPPGTGLTKPGLLLPLDFDGQAEVGQFDSRSLQLAGQEQVLGLGDGTQEFNFWDRDGLGRQAGVRRSGGGRGHPVPAGLRSGWDWVARRCLSLLQQIGEGTAGGSGTREGPTSEAPTVGTSLGPGRMVVQVPTSRFRVRGRGRNEHFGTAETLICTRRSSCGFGSKWPLDRRRPLVCFLNHTCMTLAHDCSSGGRPFLQSRGQEPF